MENKTLSKPALDVIDGYKNVPYFNNKTIRSRAALRARIGKGSPNDILEELRTILVKQHVALESLADEQLKNLLADNNLGIDCSAFVYYVLDAESLEQGSGHLNRHLTFIDCYGPLGKMICHLRPTENCSVRTLASDTNSRKVELKNVKPGDLITMLGQEGATDKPDRNHILLIHTVSYDGGVPKELHYSHAIAYPEDGLYGSGVRRGKITVAYPDQDLTKQPWSESNSTEKAVAISARAKSSTTELRRLKWFA